MNQERSNQVSNFLSKKLGMKAFSCAYDQKAKENNGYSLNSMDGLEKNSEKVKELEKMGFKVIYPAELSEKAVSRMNEEEKKVYDKSVNTHAFIVDGKQENLSLEFANQIASHYFENGYGFIGGYDTENNSITESPKGDFKNGANKEYQDLLNSIGFKTKMNEMGKVVVSSDIQYPAVKKSKFTQIYDKAKDKIQGAFAKIKSIVKAKDQVKENDSEERE